MRKTKSNSLQILRSLSVIGAFLFCQLTFAQQKVIVTGQVVDQQNEPVIGATIHEKGASNGTVSDLEGNFNLNVHQGAMLTISFVGFESASVKASPKMHVVLRENNKLLDEVLVIGYGTSKRKDVTTSVSSVSTKDLEQRPIISAIQGKAAGITVMQPNGLLGAGLSIRVRGTTSFNGSNSVLTRDWTRYLEDVAKVNKYIKNIDSVPDATLIQNERNQWKAEAKIFRVLVMFDMVRIWGNIPVITTTAGNITASNISETYKAYYPKQNTPTEAYTQIIKDLMDAVTYAPSTDIRLRYADILLLKAETEIMKGDLASAATNIDKVRNRVGLAFLTSDVVRSKDSMIEALLKGRRLELACEGQRCFDHCRFGKVESVMNAVFKTDSGSRALATPFTENSYYFPIPQNAIDQNSNLVQNPDYQYV